MGPLSDVDDSDVFSLLPSGYIEFAVLFLEHKRDFIFGPLKSRYEMENLRVICGFLTRTWFWPCKRPPLKRMRLLHRTYINEYVACFEGLKMYGIDCNNFTATYYARKLEFFMRFSML